MLGHGLKLILHAWTRLPPSAASLRNNAVRCELTPAFLPRVRRSVYSLRTHSADMPALLLSMWSRASAAVLVTTNGYSQSLWKGIHESTELSSSHGHCVRRPGLLTIAPSFCRHARERRMAHLRSHDESRSAEAQRGDSHLAPGRADS